MQASKSIMLSKAIAIASSAFVGEEDKSGEPYILHCLHVMNNVGDDKEIMAIAVLHDVIEDTRITQTDLIDAGLSIRIVQGVIRMTHKDGESYLDYIKRVSESMDTIIVKMADLEHNSNILRLKGVRDKDIAIIFFNLSINFSCSCPVFVRRSFACFLTLSIAESAFQTSFLFFKPYLLTRVFSSSILALSKGVFGFLYFLCFLFGILTLLTYS